MVMESGAKCNARVTHPDCRGPIRRGSGDCRLDKRADRRHSRTRCCARGACSLMSRANAAQSAAQVRREWGVGETQPVDILRILWSWECISVIRTPFGESSRASGLFARKNDSVLIVLNSGRTLGRRFFTAAHELYHVRFNEGMTGRVLTPCLPSMQPTRSRAGRRSFDLSSASE